MVIFQMPKSPFLSSKLTYCCLPGAIGLKYWKTYNLGDLLPQLQSRNEIETNSINQAIIPPDAPFVIVQVF